MKKLFTLASAAIIGTLVSFSAHAQSLNDNALIGRATGELSSCLAQAHQNGLEVNASVNVIGTCPDGSLLREVVFTGGPHCSPHEICPFFLVLIGSVQFDCDGNIVSSNCGVSAQ